MHPSDILVFLKSIKSTVQSIDDLLTALKDENQRAEIYGQANIPALMEVSAYQWQLEQLEMKLKAPSLIKISFSGAAEEIKEKNLEEKAEELLLAIVMHLVTKGDQEEGEETKRFKLIL